MGILAMVRLRAVHTVARIGEPRGGGLAEWWLSPGFRWGHLATEPNRLLAPNDDETWK